MERKRFLTTSDNTAVVMMQVDTMEPIHDRMPVILQPELKPCNPDLMNAYPVRPLKSDGPECIEAMDCGQ